MKKSQFQSRVVYYAKSVRSIGNWTMRFADDRFCHVCLDVPAKESDPFLFFEDAEYIEIVAAMRQLAHAPKVTDVVPHLQNSGLIDPNELLIQLNL